MKKFITLPIAIVIYFSGHAQINKGSSYLGGFVSFYSDTKKAQDTGTYANYMLNVAPSFGKAINTNLIAGISVLFNFGSQQNISSVKYKSAGYGLQLFIRKYKNLGKLFYLFAEGSGSIIYSKYNYSTINVLYDNNYRSKSLSAGIYLTPGLAYTLTKRLQAEATLQNLLYVAYIHAKDEFKTNPDISSKENIFFINSNLSPVPLYGLSFGLRVLLNK